MKSSFFKIAIASVFAVFVSSIQAQKVNWTTESTQECNEGTSQDPSSLTTFKGDIYYVYINTQRQFVVAKKSAKGLETSVAFDLEMGQHQRWHICPTIGVDKNGYIHIAGDMHNDTWKYFRSNKPEDITSWTLRNDLPGRSVTYPSFFYDNQRELFIGFRQRGADGLGDHRAGIIYYDIKADKFEMLGGLSYQDDNRITKTMFWGNGFGSDDCWYSKPGLRIYFDGKNRMHVAAMVYNICINKPDLVWGNHTHILYAYSDDKGKTWHKAGGDLIKSLPLTVDNASVAVDRTTEHDLIGGSIELGAFSSEKPVLIYQTRTDKRTHTVTWKDNAWVELKMPHISSKSLVCRPNGYIALYNGTFLDYTADGVNWKTLTGTTDFPAGVFGMQGGVDLEYFKETGNFRYHGKFENFTKSSVFTINSEIGEKNK